MPRLFRIKLNVEQDALGRTVAALERIEGVTFDFDLEAPSAPKHNGAARPPRSPRGVYQLKGSEFAMQVLYRADKPLRTSQLKDAFVKAGRGRSVASAVHALKQQGLLETTDGGYALTRKAKDRLRHRAANKGAST